MNMKSLIGSAAVFFVAVMSAIALVPFAQSATNPKPKCTVDLMLDDTGSSEPPKICVGDKVKLVAVASPVGGSFSFKILSGPGKDPMSVGGGVTPPGGANITQKAEFETTGPGTVVVQVKYAQDTENPAFLPCEDTLEVKVEVCGCDVDLLELDPKVVCLKDGRFKLVAVVTENGTNKKLSGVPVTFSASKKGTWLKSAVGNTPASNPVVTKSSGRATIYFVPDEVGKVTFNASTPECGADSEEGEVVNVNLVLQGRVEETSPVPNELNPGAVVAVNRGFDEGGDKESPPLWDYRVEGVAIAGDGDVVGGNLAFEFEEGEYEGVVSYPSTTDADGGAVILYAKIGGKAYRVPAGRQLKIEDSPRGEGAVLVAFGKETPLVIEGVSPKRKIENMYVVAVMSGSGGKVSCRDEVLTTVTDVYVVNANTSSAATRVKEPAPFLAVSKQKSSLKGGNDIDRFVVVVSDGDTAKREQEVLVDLESLVPGEKLEGEPFKKARKVRIKLAREGQGPLFTSEPMRLVTSDTDLEGAGVGGNDAEKPLAYLVDTDIDASGADTEGPANEVVDILGQIIEAAYSREGVPTSPVSIDHVNRLTVSDTLGFTPSKADDPLRIRASVYADPGFVMNLGGEDQFRRNMLRWMQRVYAQVGVAPPKLGNIAVAEIGDDRSMLSVQSRGGNREKPFRGEGRLVIPLLISGESTEVPVTLPRGNYTPRQIADRIAQAVRAATGLQVTVHMNALSNRKVSNVVPSSDIRIAGAQIDVGGGGLVDVSDVSGVSVSSAKFNRDVAVGSDQLIFMAEEEVRVGLRAFRQNPNNNEIAIFVMPSVTFKGDQVKGVAFRRGQIMKAPYRGQVGIRDSVFVRESVISPADDKYPFVISHEAGHVLMDAPHALGQKQELMTDAPQSVSARQDHVSSSKRIRSGPTAFTSIAKQKISVDLLQDKSNRGTPVDQTSSVRSSAVLGGF